MDPGLIWILGGLLLLGAEMMLPGIYLLWIGLAAIGTGLSILVLGAPSFGLVTTIFLVLLAAGISLALWLHRRSGPRPMVNSPDSGLVGRTGVALPAEGPYLRVRIGDSEWQARVVGDMAAITAGLRVRVEAVEGTTLIVRPVG